MSAAETLSSSQASQQNEIAFKIEKVQQIYDNYTTNYHAGLTLVMGHPFNDETFRNKIITEQNAIKELFIKHHLEEFLILYDVDYQVHATLLELAGQHDSSGITQRVLEDVELTRSSKTKKEINIDYTIEWIKNVEPFEVELGSDVLSEEHRNQTIRITDTGQIVMKGRAKDRKLLAEIRTDFEENAHIIHKYGKEDDEFFFVIGYLKPDFRLLDREFQTDLEKLLYTRRPLISMALKVDAVKIIVFDKYSLDREACLWESKEFKFKEEPDLPQKTLLDTIKGINKELKLAIEANAYQEAIYLVSILNVIQNLFFGKDKNPNFESRSVYNFECFNINFSTNEGFYVSRLYKFHGSYNH